VYWKGDVAHQSTQYGVQKNPDTRQIFDAFQPIKIL